MKSSTNIRFVVTFILDTAGCCSLLFLEEPFSWGFFLICMGFTPILSMSRAQRNHPIRRKDWFYFGIFLLVLLALGFLVKTFSSKSHEEAADRIMHHPAVVAGFWLLLVILLYLNWKKQKKLADT